MNARLKEGVVRTNKLGEKSHRIMCTLDGERFQKLKKVSYDVQVDANSLIKFSIDKVIRYVEKYGELPIGIELQQKES